MKKVRVITLVSVLLICMMLQLSGKDFNRKGFYLSIGGGPGISHYSIDGNIINPTNSAISYGGRELLYFATNPFPGAIHYPYSTSKFSINTNFNIGYGFNEKFVVSYMNRVGFIFDDVIHRVDYAEPYSLVLGLTGITGIECSYFFSGNVKSLYVSLGSGISVKRQPFVYGDLFQKGFGFSASGGYQLTKHLGGELNFMMINCNLAKGIENEIEDLGNGIDINGEFNAISISIGIKYLLF